METSLEDWEKIDLGARQETRMERGLEANLEAKQEIGVGWRQKTRMEGGMEANLGTRLEGNLVAGLEEDLEARLDQRVVPHPRSSWPSSRAPWWPPSRARSRARLGQILNPIEGRLEEKWDRDRSAQTDSKPTASSASSTRCRSFTSESRQQLAVPQIELKVKPIYPANHLAVKKTLLHM